MSGRALTPKERTEAVCRLGYTEREAAFLCVAALHSGFFLRRQYVQFIGKQVGGTAAELVRKALAYGHASSVTGCHNTKVYHLCARPFYAALGQEHNRNRRNRPPVVIKNRLMCLDFILEHAEGRWLATEAEKVAYFTRELGIDIAELPAKVFRGLEPKQTSRRFFPDRYPVFVPLDASTSAPLVTFCFVDEGLVTTARFETYLQEYSRTFAALKRLRLIYVAASAAHFEAAKALFKARICTIRTGASLQMTEPEFQALLAYFKARQLFEARQLDSFDRLKLIQLRDDRERFTAPEFEALYQVWTVAGERGARERIRSSQGPARVVEATFDTHLLNHNYELFGYLRPDENKQPELEVEAL